ncbi:hypothetical protein ABER68_05005 [Paenibacillus alvei]
MKKSEELITEFNEVTAEPCLTFDLGIIEVDPERIIALSLDEEDIKDDHRMKKLKASVKTNGWTNEAPQGFSLLQFPNGDLVVNGGGNHRAYLSKKLKGKGKLQYVKANVLKVVYIQRLQTEVFERLIELENLYRSEEFWEEEDQIDLIIEERKNILLSI